ncbi:hypothetical protein [Sphaerisporangium krabiense]|uniref:Uncharacterized protein n=1 Tax=Sphaerisporangium krabiense TaxID=763782 RepID=A0A7W9DRT7_9ACTN|nr:hypothetical protein [Sphaerisporangium krabiense]MBB5627700.1 hypothetical protein [Sphaerisporangium krabiense]
MGVAAQDGAAGDVARLARVRRAGGRDGTGSGSGGPGRSRGGRNP